ncbi:hypothetical protein [Mastigocoleus sp. MO_188.B34]|nr:hypothetical protein [Mastigocoleus sp. MO_188.B34]MDJ0697154.1 hypothetical protein [Mastigocoleus sp. MO_188.B34]
MSLRTIVLDRSKAERGGRPQQSQSPAIAALRYAPLAGSKAVSKA